MLKTTQNEDGTVTVSLGNETLRLTADELDHQIALLAKARCALPQRVPDEPPAVDGVVLSPPYMVRGDNDTKACLLRIRHPGVGWLNFELPARDILNMKHMWRKIVDKLDLEPLHGLYEGPERRSK